jgi:Holliday junction resolvase
VIRYHQSKRDANHNAIVRTLQQSGASVIDISGQGDDAPDIIVGFRSVNYLVEIKVEGAKLRKGQAELAARWRGAPIYVLRTRDDCLQMLGLLQQGGVDK